MKNFENSRESVASETDGLEALRFSFTTETSGSAGAQSDESRTPSSRGLEESRRCGLASADPLQLENWRVECDQQGYVSSHVSRTIGDS